MKKELFEEKIKELSSAFRCEIPSLESLKMYWKYLKHIEDEYFESICMNIIMTERFFPAISVFRDHYKKLEGTNYSPFEREYVI